MNKEKIIIVAMFAIIGTRIIVYALSTGGIISSPTKFNESTISWILPVVLPLIMITLMLLVFRRRGMVSLMSKHSTDRETPLEILKKRFARGEITKDQYEDMKNLISRHDELP